MDTGTHVCTDTDLHGGLTRGLVLYTIAPPGRIVVPPTHATSTASFQIPAVNDRAWELRKAIELHSQTLGTVSLFPALRESGCFMMLWLTVLD